MKLFRTIRWKIGILMFLGVAINYLDRVNISHAIIAISKEFSLSDIEKGYILSAFSFGYVLLMPLGGILIFKFGSRISLFFSTILLSLATILSGFTSSFYSLFSSRFFIGGFESPTFPSNAYSVSKWFPKKERGKATGLFDAGSYIGTAIAAPIIIYLIVRYNWRICFIVSGIIGLIWSVVWYIFYRDNPTKHPKITKEEANILDKDIFTIDKKEKIEWKKYLLNKKVLGMSLGFFCYNYLKSFHLTWFPTYLIESKGLEFISLSFAALFPPIFAVLGELFTGHIIDVSISKGISVNYAKKIPICIGLIFSSVITFSLFSSNMIVVIGLITLSYMFLISASVGIWSMPDELTVNKRSIAIVGSIQNTFSNIAGIVAPIITGYLYYMTKSFLAPFILSCFLAFLGAISYWFIVGDLTKNKIDSNVNKI